MIESSNIPLLRKGGVAAASIKRCEPPKSRRRGGQTGQVFTPVYFRRTDHPVRADQGCFAMFSTADPPLLFKEGNRLAQRFVHKFIDRAFYRLYLLEIWTARVRLADDVARDNHLDTAIELASHRRVVGCDR